MFFAWRIQGAMEGHRSRQRRAVAGQLQGAAAAEAEAEGGQPGGVQRSLARLLQQGRQRQLHALAQQRAIILERHHRGSGLLRAVGANILAIQVRHQHHVAALGDLAGDIHGALADAHPVRRHQQAGARRRAGSIEYQLTLEGHAVLGVGDGLHADLTHGGSPLVNAGEA